MVLLQYLLAIPLALLPRRRWDDIDLPIQDVALASALITCLVGAALGITGFFAYMTWTLAQGEWTTPPMMIYVYVVGDPFLTLIDGVISQRRRSYRERSTRLARERVEGADEPDRRHTGEWAGLTGVDFVIVSARRKPAWTPGTWVITNDGWFVLGEAFDRPTPNGLRTIYPLTHQNTLEAVRKSVQYQLPPVRPSKIPMRSAETGSPIGES